MSSKKGKLLAHSLRDLWLVLLASVGVVLLWLSWAKFGQTKPVWLFILWFLQVLLLCTNYQCVGHNFIHNEFFVSKTANSLFSVLNSVALGLPQTIYREHHLNHHRYNNYWQTLNGRSSGDLSSLYRYSSDPSHPEGFVRYAILSPLRADLVIYARSAIQRGYLGRLVAEATVLLVILAVMIINSWKFALFYYLPLLYFGHAVAYAEGYFEHHNATPGDRMTNAVSCYGWLYNIIWFNNGYHQEHHCYPGLHWTRIAQVQERMLPESERRVVNFAHFTNLRSG